MAILVGTSKEKKVFNKTLIKIGSTQDCDFVVDIGTSPLILRFSQEIGKYVLENNFENKTVLFKGVSFVGSLVLETALKFNILNSNEFLSIKLVDDSVVLTPQNNIQENNGFDFSLTEIEKQKSILEKQRSPIIKQVGFAINDIKKRLVLNNRTSLFIHVAMFFSSVVTAFGVSNFITGLKIEETGAFLNLPTNIKILALFAIIVFGLSLVLKQGAFLYYQNKKYDDDASKTAETFHLSAATFAFVAIYVINLIYYMNIGVVFAILISLFFVGLSVVLAMSAGYLKSTGHMMSYELDKYEYREDFEIVMNNYRQWISCFVNNFSNKKLENLKDRLFNLQLKSVGEIVLGIITAPFLAYGVSNTLAMCFPEAAGWIRISGLRFSPVFLVLATFLIIFAFFAFVSAFLATRKIQASEVIKHDGFSDFMGHGVNILGIQGVRKLEMEKNRSLAIACSIIFIEFTMNVSYFCTEIGGDLQGLLLSVIAALVPTALLIAETYMLSQTKFESDVINDLLTMQN